MEVLKTDKPAFERVHHWLKIINDKEKLTPSTSEMGNCSRNYRTVEDCTVFISLKEYHIYVNFWLKNSEQLMRSY